MKTKRLHGWNLSYARARELQSELAGKVTHVVMRKRPVLVAGLDCAFTKSGEKIIAAVIVVKLSDSEVVETQKVERKLTFPYIPGLLSFREAPACLAAVEKLETKPDAFLIDGQGIAHPRRLGIAAHLGLFFSKPTIGCAKSRLVGEYAEPGFEKGSHSVLTHRGERIGAVLRTRTNVRPLFVSVGNLCTLEDAIRITLACTTKYRLPEPTRLAHQFVSREKLLA